MHKHLHILLLGNAGRGALEICYKQGLLQLGHQVTLFDIQEPVHKIWQKSIFHKLSGLLYYKCLVKAVNIEVLLKCESTKPDVIIVFKGMELLPSTIQALKSTTKLLVNYNPDHPFLHFSKGSGNTFVREAIPLYDLHVSYSKNICNVLSEKYSVDTAYLPFGFMPKTALTQKLRQNFDKDIIFIGAWDKERANFFNTLPEKTVRIIGPNTWGGKTLPQSFSRKSWVGFSLYENDAMEAHATALASLNLLRPQNIISNSHNMRTFEVPGAGGLLLSPYTDEQAEFFTPDKEAIFFRNTSELLDLIKDLKKNENRVRYIKANAYQRSITSGYSYFERSKLLLSHLKNRL